MKQNNETINQKFKIYMKTCHIEVIKPKIEDKTANQFNFCSSSKNGNTAIIEIYFKTVNKFKFKIGERSKYIRKNICSLNSH